MTKKFEWFEPRLKPLDVFSTDTERGRIYESRSSGRRYWSMTTFLGLTDPDPDWYQRWVDSIGIEAAEKESERCCDRGTKIHLATELYVQNTPYEEVKLAAAEYMRMFRQLKLAVDSSVGIIYGQELPVFSDKMKLGGRLDLFAKWKGVPAIIDWKGSNFVKTRDDVESYQHQLCGYSIALQETYGVKVKKLVNVIANEKSLTPTVIVTDRDDVIESFFARLRRFHGLMPAI